MLKKILIDALYPEETRLVLLDSKGKLDEFYYQNDHKKSIKGNIYLGKVDRIEPSLQAAFVDYGNDKKGFLSFEMIHPRYYQIPTGDKEKLIKKVQNTKVGYETDEDILDTDIEKQKQPYDKVLYNSYKIQEVIKKDQILLVQVEKEERGTKGAFLTTYISLSGRYCVFLPNSEKKSCGISKKLDDLDERERLKELCNNLLENYQDASIIFRTASGYRTKAEINRDFNYLATVWQKTKDAAMSAYAPALIYEEGDLLISGIKDFYTSEVEKIIVSGNEAYQKIYKFLKIFIPKNIDKLQEHKSLSPIFHEYNVESELERLYSNKASLQSGGYLIINATEALTSIDVNSGTYTEGYSIEDTALKINLEATSEIAKQVKFRGLSGLIVIDFIDMQNLQNRKLVEKELNKAFWTDKSKVQLGKISEFGLLEMSRQRTDRSFIESNSNNCSLCSGTGKVLLTNSITLSLIKKLRFLLAKRSNKYTNVFANTDVIMHLINSRREELSLLENSYKTQIYLYINDVIPPKEYKIIFGRLKNAEIKSRSYHITNYIPLNGNQHDSEGDNSQLYEKKEYEYTGKSKIKPLLRRYGGSNIKYKKNQKFAIKDKNSIPQKNKTTPSILKKIWENIIG